MKKLHLIPNAHIDPEWLWEWEEGYSEVIHTCKFIAELMEEEKSLTFTRSSACCYLWIEEADKELFKKIKKLVKKKRWWIAGPWWVQSDCNIPSGESFVRHCLYGKKYFKEKFGIDVKVGYNPDAFGHNGNLPQILKKCGIDFYLFCRPAKHEKKLPQIFWWESPDGSKILACRPPAHYNTTDEILEKRIREVSRSFYSGLKDVICMIGVGNHGGGPTRKSIEIIKKLKEDKSLPEIIYSNPYRFFKNILKYKKDFPVIQDELQYHARGCYTSYPQIKQINRIAENKVITAEAISAFLFITDGENYFPSKIENIWREILFNQFHDILAGSSTPEAYFDCMNMLGKAIILSERIINKKLWNLSKIVDTEKIEGNPVLFFNPTSFEREEIKKISFSPDNTLFESKEICFYDEKGEKVLSQAVEDVNTSLKDYMLKIKIPPFGYRVYWWKSCREKDINKNLKLTENSIENQILKIEIDEKTAGIKNLILKKENWNSFKKTGGEFIVIEDTSDAWGHRKDSFRSVIGKFKCENIMSGENGECMVSIRGKTKYNNSEILLEYILYDNTPFVEVRGKINWQEKHKFLKVSFPLNMENPKIFVEMPYYFIERKKDGKENPSHKWIDITGKVKNRKYGISIVNSEWYGYDFDGKELRMSVLRSPVFGSFKEKEDLKEGKFYDYQSRGILNFRYLILPHKGDFRKINTIKYAIFLNQPVEYILPLRNKGELPSSFSLIKTEPENIVVSVLKMGEKEKYPVLRIYESYGKNTEGKIEIFGKRYRINLKKFEIKTLMLKNGKFIETNLMEKEK